MAEDSLLDVFVNVKIKDEVLKSTEDTIDSAVKRLQQKFGAVNTSIASAGAAAARASGGASGGGSGGGSGGASALAQQYRTAARAAQDLAIETGRVGQLVKSVKSEELSQNFRVATNELKDLQTIMKSGREDADPLALEETLRRLQLVRERLQELSTQTSGGTFGRRNQQEDFAQIIENERLQKSNFRIDVGLRGQFSQGAGFDKKKELAQLSAEAQRAEVQFESLARTFRNTGKGLDTLILQSARLKGSRGALVNSFDEIKLGSQSFNTLSNIAYQAGQAVEDFAVGFSLNGLAGGIRGAANNVAFILNDMSRLPQVTKAATAAVKLMKPALPLKEAQELGAKYASMIPLAAGLGSAFAIVVLPKMVEWLQTLTEVEFKLQDIGEQIRRNVADADFSAGLDIGSSKFQRDLENAKSIEDVVEKTNALLEKRDENQKKIVETTKALDDSGALLRAAGDIKTALELALKARDATLDKISLEGQKIFGGLPSTGNKAIDTLVDRSLPGRIFGGVAGDKDKLSEDFRAAREGVKLLQEAAFALDKAQESVLSGKPGANKDLVAASDLFAKISAEVDKAKASADGFFFSGISKEKAESLKKSLSELSSELDKLNRLSRESEEIQNRNITQGLDAIIAKNKELAFGIKLTQKEIAGTTFEGASKINELFQKNDKVRKGIDDLILKALQQNDPSTRRKALVAADAANETQSLAFQNELGSLLKKSKEELKKIEDKDRKSTFTNPEDFAKKLQANVLSSDDKLIKSQEDLRKEIQVLNEAISKERNNFGENGGKFFPLSDRGAASKRADQLGDFRSSLRVGDNGVMEEKFVSAIREAVQWLADPFGKVVQSQDKTTDAVKKIPGAVAQ